MTNAQQTILRIVREPGHLTAEHIYARVKKEIPTVALGTVYRNLNQFADEHMIRRIPRANAPDLYDGNMRPHEHIICVGCGAPTDVRLPGIKQFISAHAGEEILSVEVSAGYVCSVCKEKGLELAAAR